MDEKEAEARPVMGTIFLVIITSLRVIRTKFARTIIGERSEPHSL